MKYKFSVEILIYNNSSFDIIYNVKHIVTKKSIDDHGYLHIKLPKQLVRKLVT